MAVCPECGLNVDGRPTCPVDGTPLIDPGADTLLGTRVGSFRVARLLGEGGMGQVYLGVHPEIGSRVAIKVLSHDCSRQRDLVQRFFAEAKAVNLIRNEGIVNVIDLAALEDGRPYIVMEYLDGVALSALFERTGPMPLGTLGNLILEVLRAIGAAHDAGIVHRDLKPDNIFVTAGGRAKVLDFGIAKLREDLIERSSATRSGSVLGTPHYMAPEQAMGRKIDARADLYALGIILYEGATGRRPIPGDSLYALIRNHVEHIPAAPRPLRPDLPEAYEAAILRALAKDPNARFGSAMEFGAALELAMRGLEHAAWSSVAASRSAIPPTPHPHVTPTSWHGAEIATGPGGSVPAIAPATPRSIAPRFPATPKPRRFGATAGIASFATVAIAGALAVAWWQLRDRDDAIASPGVATPTAADPPSPEEPEGNHAPTREPPNDAGALQHHGAAPSDATAPVDAPLGSVTPVDAEAPTDPIAPIDAKAPQANTRNPEPANANSRTSTTAPPITAARGSDATRPTDAASTKTQPESPSPRRETSPETPSSKFAAFDVIGFLPQAKKIAQKHHRDAELVKILANAVRPDGRADLTLKSGLRVTYRFRSVEASKQPSALPMGMPTTVECMIVVDVSSNGVSSYTTTTPHKECGTPLPMPRCSARGIWKKAIAAGAPSGNAVATLIYDARSRNGPPEWRVDVPYFFDKRWLPDDC